MIKLKKGEWNGIKDACHSLRLDRVIKINKEMILAREERNQKKLKTAMKDARKLQVGEGRSTEASVTKILRNVVLPESLV